jgi:hypothetical protein
MHVVLHFDQAEPAAVVDERSDQPRQKPDRNAGSSESGQNAEHTVPHVEDLRFGVRTVVIVSGQPIQVERGIERDLGMCVQKAYQRGIRRKIGLIGEKTRIEFEGERQGGRIAPEKIRQVVPDTLRVWLLHDQVRHGRSVW